jgi:hypothetical protein
MHLKKCIKNWPKNYNVHTKQQAQICNSNSKFSNPKAVGIVRTTPEAESRW